MKVLTTQQRVKLQEELQELTSKSKDVNVVFVIDGTKVWKDITKSVAASVQKVFDDSETLAIGARLRFGM